VVQLELEAARGRGALRRGKLAAMMAQETARSGEGAVAGADQRPRGRGRYARHG
jgi:hypothetical protein